MELYGNYRINSMPFDAVETLFCLQAALEGLGSGMLGDIAVRRKAVASETVTQADSFQWTVVFLTEVHQQPTLDRCDMQVFV